MNARTGRSGTSYGWSGVAHLIPGKPLGPAERPWDRCAARRRSARWASPAERTEDMAGIESNTPGFLPYDNAALRQRLADIPPRTTSIAAELRALVAGRPAPQAEGKTKRRPPWSEAGQDPS